MDRVIETDVSIRVGRGKTREGKPFVTVVSCDNRGPLTMPVAMTISQAISFALTVAKAAFSGWRLF